MTRSMCFNVMLQQWHRNPYEVVIEELVDLNGQLDNRIRSVSQFGGKGYMYPAEVFSGHLSVYLTRHFNVVR